MARAKAKTVTPADAAPSGQPWAYGIRTWDKDGRAYNDFAWDLTAGARTEAPDWRPTKACGAGLHCNPQGLGDWDLLNSDPGALMGIVRYDPALAIDLDGKVKAPWMDVVATTLTHSRGQIMQMIATHSRAKVAEIIAGAGAKTTTATKKGESASAAGDSGHASAAGDRGHASAAGDRGHASAAGDSGHASAAGDSGHASAAGDSGHASAAGDRGHASAAGYSGHASAAGYRGHASAAGDSGHASAAGDRGHASAAGQYGIAAAFGIEGTAEAAETGAIMLAAWERQPDHTWKLMRVFAGMAGETHGDVTIEPGKAYRLNLDGTLSQVGAA